MNAARSVTAMFNIATTNQSPSVNGGADRAITLPTNSVSLTGAATDDGLPAGSTLTVTWSRVSGAGTVTFSNANALTTTATFSSAGTYVLRLSVSDSALTASDDVTVTVNSAPTPGTYISNNAWQNVSFARLHRGARLTESLVWRRRPYSATRDLPPLCGLPTLALLTLGTAPCTRR